MVVLGGAGEDRQCIDIRQCITRQCIDIRQNSLLVNVKLSV